MASLLSLLKSNDILKDFVVVVGSENAPGLSTIQRWAAKFRASSTSVSDAPRSGRPSTSTNEEMTNEVERLVGEDQRITVIEISYSPNLSPCGHFPMMKEPIRGVRFETVDEITGAVLEQLKTLQKNGLDGDVPRLPHRWQSCMRALRDYFEGINELHYKI